MLMVTGNEESDVIVYALNYSNCTTVRVCGSNLITTIPFVQRTFHKSFPLGCFLFSKTLRLVNERTEQTVTSPLSVRLQEKRFTPEEQRRLQSHQHNV